MYPFQFKTLRPLSACDYTGRIVRTFRKVSSEGLGYEPPKSTTRPSPLRA